MLVFSICCSVILFQLSTVTLPTVAHASLLLVIIRGEAPFLHSLLVQAIPSWPGDRDRRDTVGARSESPGES